MKTTGIIALKILSESDFLDNESQWKVENITLKNLKMHL